MNSVYVSALIAVVLWIAWQALERDFRCGYCGELAKHDAGCPYNLDREERR